MFRFKSLLICCLFLMPGISAASPGSCYGFFTSLYDEQIAEAMEQENRGSVTGLHNLRTRYDDNRAALEFLHEQQEATGFEDAVSQGREMAQRFLAQLDAPTPDTEDQLRRNRVYCLGLLEEADKQQRNDTFVAAMEAIDEGSVYGEDECAPLEEGDLLANTWRGLIGTRLYRLELIPGSSGWDGVLKLNRDRRFHNVARLTGEISGGFLTLTSGDSDRTIWVELIQNSDCEARLSGEMRWNNGSHSADINFHIVD